jgi:hypothetical protein
LFHIFLAASKGAFTMANVRSLTENEAIELVLSILKAAGKPLTTKEIEEETRKRLVQCPDKTPIFLNRLRLRGAIKGQLSPERRGWVWWVEKSSKP